MLELAFFTGVILRLIGISTQSVLGVSLFVTATLLIVLVVKLTVSFD